MLMDGDDIVTVKQDYCEWDSEDITDVECNSEIRMDLSEGTYNLVTATGCYNEWDEATEEMGDLICDQTGEYNYTMYWAENMTENRNILGSVDDDSPIMEFDYMDYMEFSQGDYGFAPVYETYEFNVGPDGFKGEIFSYQYRWENNCEDDCESEGNMILWIYEYSFNPDNTVDNLMAISGHNDFYDDENDEYDCCYSMLDIELTEGTYIFVMSGDYTHMISDDYSTIYHDTIISEYDDEGDLEPYRWYEGTLDSNDSRAYFPSNYYDYEDHGDDKDGDGEEMLFMAMIENATAYQDGDITAEEAANNFIDLMYAADAMGLYDDKDGDDDDGGDDGNDVYWQSYEGGYCEWEGDVDGEENAWYCKYSEDDEDWNTWWYYCENHDSDWHCTDDFGQSEDYEHSADGTEWSGSGDNDGPPTPEEAMQMTDTDGDGYASYQEIQDMWESEPSNPELDWDEVTILFDDCDYDGNDLIDIDEMQCFIDGIGAMLGGGGDDPDPEQMMDYMDTDDDGYLSLQELFDYLNGEREQNGEPPMTSEDEDAYAAWFYSGDADGDDLLSLDEFAQLLDSTGDDDGEEPPTAENFVDWFDTDGDGVLTLDEIIDGIRNTNNVSGELPPSAEDEAYMEAAFNDADENADGVLDLDELGHFIYVIDGDGDGDDGDDEPFHVTMMVIDQTLNAPISDFEVRFLGDCGEPDEEGNEPPISDCTVYASNGLTEGSATVDPAIAEYEFTYEYLDYDGDGLISDMDTLVIDNLMPGVKVELYDTWADQYTSDSYATSQVPGFGALMAVVVLLGAAFATRRD